MTFNYRDAQGRFARALVKNIPQGVDFDSDSQDVQAIKDLVGHKADEYDSFFTVQCDGDFIAVWGMIGIIPYNTKSVKRIV